MALYYISQRYSDHVPSNEESKLHNDFKEAWERCFSLAVDDSFIIFGTFLTSFVYWEKEYTLKIVADFQTINEENWKSFMGGWLFWNYRGYSPELHKSLIPHYKKAIKSGFDINEGSSKSGLVRRLTIAYYWEYENLDSELMHLALEELSFEKLETLIRILRYDHKELLKNRKMYDRVVPLWGKLVAILRKREGTGKKKAIADTLMLSKYSETLDEETYKRIEFVLTSDNEKVYLRDFLKELSRFLQNDSSITKSFKICTLINLIVSKHYPYNFDKNLQKLMEELFALENEQLNSKLKDICNNIIQVNNGYVDWPSELAQKY